MGVDFFFQIKVFFERTRVSRVARARVYKKLKNGRLGSFLKKYGKPETEYLGRKAREDGTPLRLTKEKVSTFISFLLK